MLRRWGEILSLLIKTPRMKSNVSAFVRRNRVLIVFCIGAAFLAGCTHQPVFARSECRRCDIKPKTTKTLYIR
jgi:hypothetical protein